MIAEKDDLDNLDIGANASAEEAEEGTEEAVKKGYDVVIRGKLQPMPPFDKKSFVVSLWSFNGLLEVFCFLLHSSTFVIRSLF